VVLVSSKFCLEILMKISLCAFVVPVFFAAMAPVAYAGAYGQEAGGAAPKEMDLLGSPATYADPYGAATNGRGGLATSAQTGYAEFSGGAAQMKGAPRPGKDEARARLLNMPQAAAAAVYPTPSGLKPPGNQARVREIYKSPY
jgi:hypothetical protein